jgi:hypothetical protein
MQSGTPTVHDLFLTILGHFSTCSWHSFFFFTLFLLDIFFIYISNAIPQAPYNLPRPAPQPTHSCFLALAFPCTGAYDLRKTQGLSSHWWPTRPPSATYAIRDTVGRGGEGCGHSLGSYVKCLDFSWSLNTFGCYLKEVSHLEDVTEHYPWPQSLPWCLFLFYNRRKKTSFVRFSPWYFSKHMESNNHNQASSMLSV